MEGSKKSYCKGIFYSFTDMPGALPVNTLGRGWFPTPDSRAIEPTTTKMSVITVPAINTNGLKAPSGTRVSQSVSQSNSQPRTGIDPQRTRSRPSVHTCSPPSIVSDPPNLE
jgi:hypothetical protein